MIKLLCSVCGSCVLAPARARKLDRRRFCLPCSASGPGPLLVERFSPAARRQAEAKKRRAAKAAKARAEADAAFRAFSLALRDSERARTAAMLGFDPAPLIAKWGRRLGLGRNEIAAFGDPGASIPHIATTATGFALYLPPGTTPGEVVGCLAVKSAASTAGMRDAVLLASPKLARKFGPATPWGTVHGALVELVDASAPPAVIAAAALQRSE